MLNKHSKGFMFKFSYLASLASCSQSGNAIAHEPYMNLIFLGTSAGVPTKTRNVSGVALRESKGKGWYLIDCGEGTQHQVLHTKLSFHSRKAILVTHVHGDHCYGLPGILASAATYVHRNLDYAGETSFS